VLTTKTRSGSMIIVAAGGGYEALQGW